MRTIYYLFFLLACGLLGGACTDRFPVSGLSNNLNLLVVDGRFTNENRIQTLNLSRSVAFNTATLNGFPPETGAKVSVTDNTGKIIDFEETGPGIYATTTAVSGEVGKSYMLRITTADGKQYESFPEQMIAVAPIKGLKTKTGQSIDDEGISRDITLVNVTMDDPGSVSNYYLWIWKSQVNKDFGSIDASWSVSNNSDRLFDGQELAFDLDEEFDKGESLYVQVYQMGITKTANDFLNLLDTQERNDLGPLSIPSASVRGNVFDKSDPKKFTLGFFLVVSVDSAQIKLE